jgi:hypothetical protein
VLTRPVIQCYPTCEKIQIVFTQSGPEAAIDVQSENHVTRIAGGSSRDYLDRRMTVFINSGQSDNRYHTTVD